MRVGSTQKLARATNDGEASFERATLAAMLGEENALEAPARLRSVVVDRTCACGVLLGERRARLLEARAALYDGEPAANAVDLERLEPRTTEE